MEQLRNRGTRLAAACQLGPLRKYRTERARERMKAHGLGAMLCMYDENVRYVTGTLTPGWNRLKPGLRYAIICGDDPPVLFEQGDLGFQIERHSPWIPKENVRWSYAWIKGAAGPPRNSRSRSSPGDHPGDEEERRGGPKLGVDFIDINMIQAFKDANIEWTDGMSAMMEARAVKNVDEQECLRMVGAIGDAAHWETMKFLRPGVTENQVTAHIMKFLYSIPGMEDVEDVIVSSGPNTWPNWRNFSDRIIQPATSCSWISPRSPGTATSRATTAPTASARSRARSRRTSTPRRSSGSTTRSTP